tara:strand:+ start:3260 stop:3478 length:219 start_codon:yes stop_codon:yes gene_type:complete
MPLSGKAPGPQIARGVAPEAGPLFWKSPMPLALELRLPSQATMNRLAALKTRSHCLALWVRLFIALLLKFIF